MRANGLKIIWLAIFYYFVRIIPFPRLLFSRAMHKIIFIFDICFPYFYSCDENNVKINKNSSSYNTWCLYTRNGVFHFSKNED